VRGTAACLTPRDADVCVAKVERAADRIVRFSSSMPWIKVTLVTKLKDLNEDEKKSIKRGRFICRPPCGEIRYRLGSGTVFRVNWGESNRLDQTAENKRRDTG
jgi:hypothetical protein